MKALSSRLLQMKFMKRGQAAETTTQAASTSAAAAQVTRHGAVLTQSKNIGQNGVYQYGVCIGLVMAITRAAKAQNLFWASGGAHRCF